tara:strand:- start:636 stop:2285 length:1650 start_codon:yes stop_codon:yes gene_type:complete
MITCRLANSVWKHSARGDWRSYMAAAHTAQHSQEVLLKSILDGACPSSFAKKFGLAKNMSVTEFQESLPVTNYRDHYAEFVKRIHQGESQVLLRQPVHRLVPTTGSSGKAKLIPYTKALKKSFQRVVNTWIYDLHCQNPLAFRGKSYWSVTPVVQQTFEDGVVPIGFESDEEYLSPLARMLSRTAIVDAPSFSGNEQATTVIRLTALKLLSEPNLSLISVWSPTLLLNILNVIWHDQENLLRALSSGEDHFLKEVNSNPRVRYKKNPKRTREIEKSMDSLRSRESLAKVIWPQLSLISCWGDAGSKSYCEQIKQLEPDIPVQAKGLLSTEGCVSFPLGTAAGHVPAIESTFLEFIPESATGEVRLLDQLELDHVYEVVMTTYGGLYRYATGDQIKVIGFSRGLPRFEFIGRTNQVIDLVGEKVPLQSIEQAAAKFLKSETETNRFWVVAPVALTPAIFRIYISGLTDARGLRESILARLRENPHYVNAESLGQIVAPEIRSLPASFTIQSFHSLKSELGNQLGAVKESRVEYSPQVVARLNQLSKLLEN